MKQSELEKLKKQLWLNLEKERKRASKQTSKDLANSMGIGEGFLSAVVNGRKEPFFDTFIKYIVYSGFLSSLTDLKVCEEKLGEHIKIRNKIFALISENENTDFLKALLKIIQILKKMNTTLMNRKR